MASLSRSRDYSLLGHAPSDPYAGGADPQLRSPYENSDVDFSDVFGGPPRLSSVYQEGHGPGESPGWRGGGGAGEEPAVARRPWSCSSGEKPVFGGIGSPARRRQVADDFFDDVFRRNESVCSTPRTVERDLFSSNPGSRVLSPARPLPPASDVLGRGSSVPAQLSFPTRLVKGSDHPVFGSSSPDVAYRNEKSISDVFSIPSPTAYSPTNSRSAETKDEPKSGTHASCNESALYRRTCHDHYRSLEAAKLGSNRTSDTEMQPKKDSPVLQAYSGGSYFHFSMYKWPSIEVALVMPYNLKERTKSGTKVSGVSAENLQAADCPPDNQCMPQGCRAFHNQCDLEDKSQSSDLAATEIHDTLTKEVEKVLPASFDTKSVQSDIADKTETKLNLSMSPLDDIDTCDEDGVNVSVEAWKPELQSLPRLPSGCVDREGDKGITGWTRNKESMVIDHTMKTRHANDPAKFQQTSGESIKATQEGKMLGGRVKGKVKEFIKIFNQEPAPRSGGTVENQPRRPRIRNEAKGRLDACVSARVANADEYEKETVENEALSTAPMAANQSLGIGEKEHTNSVQNMGNSSIEGKGVSSVLRGSTLETLDASFCNIEEVYIENIDECLVEEFPQNQIEVTKADLRREEMKTSDAKIREWSKGKEGNIRSLLSTLQYVLWPGSGWKPIPLVDIIEGASVRRAYQKALLCLHPDKLQQKGAEMHKKYIAEKVFDILQDAWTHFNSVSSL